PDARRPDAAPVSAECLGPADRRVSCTVSLRAEVVGFESQGPPSAPVELRYNTAWDVPEVFPVACVPLATAAADAAGGFMVDFGQLSCASVLVGKVAIF